MVAPSVRIQEEKTSRRQKAEHRGAVRARIVVLAAQGRSNAEGALLAGHEKTVRLWRGRFASDGRPRALKDRKRSGRPARVTVGGAPSS